LKIGVLLEMIESFTFFPKKLYIVCEYVNIDYDDDWQISYQQPGFSQELKTTPFTKCFI